jgi:5-methylcytosine-specific restriction enzyme subunit McrC
MRTETIVETSPAVIALSDDEAHALTAAGRRLAGDKRFWGHQDDEASEADHTPAERTVIRCERVAQEMYRVTVAQAVGIVALPTVQIVVQPKIPLPHFHFLLDHSPTVPRPDVEQAAAEASTELWDLVATWFVTAVERLLRHGLLADYEEQHDELPFLRGTLRSLDTTTAYYQGRVALSCDFDEFGLNGPLNRVLRAATEAVVGTPVLSPNVRRKARRALARLDEVGPLRSSDLRHPLDRRSADYRVPIALAHHVLSATGRTVATGSSLAWTFLIATPAVVEDAIRTILRHGLADALPVTSAGLTLTPSRLRLNPDLVFGTTATGDVKYSLLSAEWRRSDLYQAVAFATGYRVEHAGVFGFSTAASRPPAVQVGPVALRAFTWDARATTEPSVAAAELVLEARSWLTPHVGTVAA